MGLAIEVVGASGGEGLFPGFAGGEGEVSMAELIVAVEHGVVGSHLVVDELDGVAGFDVHGAGLEGQHAGIGAKLHFNGRSVGGGNTKAKHENEGEAGGEKGAQTVDHHVSDTSVTLARLKPDHAWEDRSPEGLFQDSDRGFSVRTLPVG